MTAKKRYYIINSQCYRREDEINYIKSNFEDNQYESTNSIRQADIIIYFTCGLGEKTINEELRNIEDLQLSKKKDGELIVAGCIPAMHPDKLERIFKGITITPTNYLPLNDILNQNINFDVNAFSKYNKYKDLSKICISKGCIRRCAFCKTRISVGKLRSKSIDNIIKELKFGLKHNIDTFTLYADNVGDYGADKGINIGNLFDAIAEVDGKFQLKINDFYPTSLLKCYDSIKALAALGKINMMHFPVQTGNQRVLHIMNRHYDLKEVVTKLKALKKVYPVKYMFDFIIGFPTETEEEFQDTIEFIKEFSKETYVFSIYHDMPLTDSYNMEGKLSEDIKAERYERIKKLNVDIYFEVVNK